MTLRTRINDMERRTNPPALVAGPYDPADKPPFDYAGFARVFVEYAPVWLLEQGFPPGWCVPGQEEDQ